MEQRFKIGDKVRCVNRGNRRGLGYILNKIFIINKINYKEVAFPRSGNGVYFESLELVNKPLYKIY